MPEYNPPLSLPTGLVEQNIDRAANRNNPWAALASNLGNDVARGVDVYKQRQANKPLTPDQLAQIQAGKVPQGLSREQSLSLAEKMAVNKTNMSKQLVPVDPGVQAVYKQAGYDAPTDPQVSAREFDAVKQLALAKQKANLKPPSAYDNMDGLIEGIHQFVQSGGKEGTDPQMLPGFGKNSLKSEALSQINKKYPDDYKQLAAAERGNKAATGASTAEARAPFGQQQVQIRNMANSLVPQLDLLSKASDAVSRGDVKLINEFSGKLGTQFSDKDWSTLKKRAAIAADEFQAQIGSGSDAKLDLAKQLIDASDSPEVLKSAIDIMKSAVKARAIASTGKKPTEEQISEETPNNAGKGGVSLPAPEDIDAELKRRGVQ